MFCLWRGAVFGIGWLPPEGAASSIVFRCWSSVTFSRSGMVATVALRVQVCQVPSEDKHHVESGKAEDSVCRRRS